jgi:hypothetical protein
MTYKFVGDGTGVPGLPHEITDAEAKELGVSEILKEAVKNGSYVESVSLTPDPSSTGRGEKKSKGDVNNG